MKCSEVRPLYWKFGHPHSISPTLSLRLLLLSRLMDAEIVGDDECISLPETWFEAQVSMIEVHSVGKRNKIMMESR